MEDQYEVVCALSDSATFDDLANGALHPIHSMFGSRLGFSGLVDRMALFAVR